MKYHIWTIGCQMNVADSERLSRALEKLNYQETNLVDEADLIVLNTCVVRQSAEDKALGRLNSLKPLKAANPNLIIALMGCLVGIKGNPAMEKRYPWVDAFAAPSDPESILRAVHEKHSPVFQPLSDLNEENIEDLLREEFGIHAGSLHSVSENLPIVLGCSHACAYCIIPHNRGKERSRDPQRILEEAKTMVARGAKEIVLLGQIVDRYGLDRDDGVHLAQLLAMVNDIDGLERIRFLTSHPNYMSDDLIKAVASLPKVMPHIELPIQAGDDEVLKAMRRGYTNAQYRDIIAHIRDLMPEVSIGTDIIVGFPGESEVAFEETYKLLADLKMDVAHLARYSPRPGTYSERLLGDDVPEEEKMRRFRELEKLQKQIVGDINKRFLNQRIPVLFEGRAKGKWRGRSPHNRLVFVESTENLLGQIRDVHIDWT
ncbi:MAG: tRNA (N6-isopentenyl adenosine(37)-C2)-methylthiotransferase MiaB, partial [Chloroflexi bacterium]|nr:tRNA (N6-isopentenyl adenosine(37)-C2)-methylthiotransferase MiaB [Chloroflexota bacterium]